MFSSKEQLIKKTGKHGIGRLSFLEQLVNEFKTTKSRDAKEQVLANLANFAYDPVNYEYLRRVKILELFMITLEDNNSKLVSFAIGGICNICLEPYSREYILRINGVQIISSLLSRKEESIILSAITTLIYLNTPNSKPAIASPENVERMLGFSKSTNRRIKNLANIFLEDYCGIKQSQGPTASTSKSASGGKSKRTSTITSATAIKNIDIRVSETLTSSISIAANTSASEGKSKCISTTTKQTATTSLGTSNSVDTSGNTVSNTAATTSTAPF